MPPLKNQVFEMGKPDAERCMAHFWSKAACFLAFIVIALPFLLSSCSWLEPGFDEDAWREKVMAAETSDLYAPNHDGKTFFNPWMPMEKKSILTLLRWQLTPGKAYTREEKQFLPPVLPEPEARIRKAGGSDFIFWVGHGTFFMRINGQYWLTDPIFSKRALLPARKTPPGISVDEILTIVGSDRLNVLVSHNHYDHLDKASISALPPNARFYVPMGLEDFFVRMGKTDVTGMNWWESLEVDSGAHLVCLPNQHWSRRIGQGYNTVLWASFLIRTPGVTVFFDGDGGYSIGYREIGRRFPGIDYALIPTTAYHPRWFMHYNHMSVDEAIEAFHDLGASYFIPTQWGTFSLGDEPAGYPGLDLMRTIEERELDPKQFLILDIGGLHIIGTAGSNNDSHNRAGY